MSRIAPLFPAEVVCEEAAPEDGVLDDLFPAERALIARAVEKRQLEFAAARACARRALGRLDLPPSPVLHDDRRAPLWPEGIVGSITHTRGYCGVAVARRGAVVSVGLDVEQAGVMREAMWRRILTDREVSRITARGDTPEAAARLYFSAKEAFYKCQYPITHTYLGFHDAEVEISDATRFRVVFLREAAPRFQPGDALEGRFVVADDYVMTGVTLHA